MSVTPRRASRTPRSVERSAPPCRFPAWEQERNTAAGFGLGIWRGPVRRAFGLPPPSTPAIARMVAPAVRRDAVDRRRRRSSEPPFFARAVAVVPDADDPSRGGLSSPLAGTSSPTRAATRASCFAIGTEIASWVSGFGGGRRAWLSSISINSLVAHLYRSTPEVMQVDFLGPHNFLSPCRLPS